MSDDKRDGSVASTLRNRFKELVFARIRGPRSSHITEAIAAGVGYRSHTAYMADLKDTVPVFLLVDAIDRNAMAARLAGLTDPAISGVSLRDIEAALSDIATKAPETLVPVGRRSSLLADAGKARMPEIVDAPDHSLIDWLMSIALEREATTVTVKDVEGHRSITLRKGEWAEDLGNDLPGTKHDSAYMSGKRYVLSDTAKRRLPELVRQIRSICGLPPQSSGYGSIGGRFITADGNVFDVVLVKSERGDVVVLRKSTGEDTYPAPPRFQFDNLLEEAIDKGVSDIHIEPRGDRHAVYFRIDGNRECIREGGFDTYEILLSSAKIQSRMHPSARKGQVGGFKLDYRGRWIGIHVMTVNTVDGWNIVVLISDPATKITDIDTLGITRVELWKQSVSRAGGGIWVIGGPAGSGKTTTLNATFHAMPHGTKFFPVADPVSYDIVETNTLSPGTPRPTAASRGGPGRADPEVYVMGEIRDRESMERAVAYAARGMKVFVNISVGSVTSTFVRLKDLQLDQANVGHIRGILVQALARTEPKGRTVISELAVFDTPEQAEAACRDALAGQAVAVSSMLDDLMDKVEAGIVSRTEAERVFGKAAIEGQRGVAKST